MGKLGRNGRFFRWASLVLAIAGLAGAYCVGAKGNLVYVTTSGQSLVWISGGYCYPALSGMDGTTFECYCLGTEPTVSDISAKGRREKTIHIRRSETYLGFE